MAHANTDHIHNDSVPDEDAEREHDPGQVGCVEGEEAEKAHLDIRIPSTPHIRHHECKSTPQEVHVDVGGHHADVRDTKQQHQQVVRSATAKVAFLQ